MEKTVADHILPKVTGRLAQVLFVLAVLLILLSASLLLTPARFFAAYGAPGVATATANSWDSLTLSQKQALGPLAKDWNSMPAERQKKWLVFAVKFQKMTPPDQQRALEKMSDWVKLTPEQRLAARENYIRSNKLQPDQRAQKWQEYQQLSDEEKIQLANHPQKKKLITNLPSPSESKEKKLQPLKTQKSPKPEQVAVPQTVAPSDFVPMSSSVNPHSPHP